MNSVFNTTLESYIPFGDNPFNMIKDKIVVAFDTETTGFNPRINQLTEIAAIAFEGNTFNEIGTYHTHVRLNDDTLAQIEKERTQPAKGMNVVDILKMTEYYNSSEGAVDEREAIDGLSEFIESKAIIVAHNAKFDLKMVNTRARKLGTQPIRHHGKVLDTMLLSREFFIPMSQELEMDGDAEAKNVLDKLTHRWTKSDKRQKISSKLGDLSAALTGDISNWHQALDDTRTTMSILKQFKEFFDKHFGSELKYNHDFLRRYNRAYQQRKRK